MGFCARERERERKREREREREREKMVWRLQKTHFAYFVVVGDVFLAQIVAKTSLLDSQSELLISSSFSGTYSCIQMNLALY